MKFIYITEIYCDKYPFQDLSPESLDFDKKWYSAKCYNNEIGPEDLSSVFFVKIE